MKILLFFLSFVLMLFFSKDSVQLAADGLSVWFQTMIPALFPFMLLSCLLVRQQMTEKLSFFLSPLLCPLLRISPQGVYCVLTGFLCGFPMGARNIAELYRIKEISRKEAQYLLGFCNNMGPLFILSVLLPSLAIKNIPAVFFLLGIYGIPFLYALLVRLISPLPLNLCQKSPSKAATEPFLKSLDSAIHSGIEGITVLGAYLIVGNLLYLFPLIVSRSLTRYTDIVLPDILLCASRCLLEITGGIHALSGRLPLFLLTVLPLGGLCCLLQTKGMLAGTDLSMRRYVFDKLLQCLLSFFYFFLLFRFFL